MQDAYSAAQLDKLSEVCVKVGVNLQEGQDLVITAPMAALPMVRQVTAHAYKAGAGLVSAFFVDDEMTLARYQHGHDSSFDRAPDWLYEGMAKAFEGNAARMAISGDNPMLLSNEDSTKVGRANKANSLAIKPALQKIAGFDINWSVVSYPNPAWAKQMFPELDEGAAVAKLAKAIFAACRVDQADPVAAWAEHNKVLAARRDWLNGQNFAALKYTGPGTDLTLGLADGHEWQGGASTAKNGVTCNANIPTEEVFTAPHAMKVEGTVSSTKPLSHQGTLIDDIQVRFESGRIVEAKASKGEEVLLKVLDTDEGSRRLGEVALVPHSSPISASGLLFYNTLYDENAACHIALGQCYAKTFRGGDKITPDEVKTQGGNSSLIHIDWMIGSDKVDIDGVTQSGETVPVFRKGEWA